MKKEWSHRGGSYLEAAERDHAVHHLGHAEAVPEIVEGVVSVIVVDTQLQREGMKLSETAELFPKHCISLKESYGAQDYSLPGQSDSTRPLTLSAFLSDISVFQELTSK